MLEGTYTLVIQPRRWITVIIALFSKVYGNSTGASTGSLSLSRPLHTWQFPFLTFPGVALFVYLFRKILPRNTTAPWRSRSPTGLGGREYWKGFSLRDSFIHCLQRLECCDLRFPYAHAILSSSALSHFCIFSHLLRLTALIFP